MQLLISSQYRIESVTEEILYFRIQVCIKSRYTEKCRIVLSRYLHWKLDFYSSYRNQIQPLKMNNFILHIKRYQMNFPFLYIFNCNFSFSCNFVTQLALYNKLLHFYAPPFNPSNVSRQSAPYEKLGTKRHERFSDFA